MCGIAGVRLDAGRDGASADIACQAGQRLVDSLAHRGPDDQGLELVTPGGEPSNRHSPVSVVFGHTRLAILDLSPAGHQPMHDPRAGTWITFNGEIYNFGELRAQLDDGGSWRSHSDTEVILRAYARWGRDCVKHLRGMFAFAIWDNIRRELFLARDRLGIKPLYYYSDGPVLVFASEIRALLASGLVPRRLDRQALWQLLAYQCVPAPRSLIAGVRMLAPGSWLVVDAQGRIAETRYWDLLDNASPQGASASQAEAQVRVAELLQEAVAAHLVSDVPVSVFLSGGLDSTALLALTCEAGYSPQTFSVAFPQQEVDEGPLARLVAKRFGTAHTEVTLHENDLLDQIPQALAIMDHATGDGVNSYLVARAVSAAGIKVALSGLGGDELFAGYSSFSRLRDVAQLGRVWKRIPAAGRRAVAASVRKYAGRSIAVQKAAEMLSSDGSLEMLYLPVRQLFVGDSRTSLLKDHWLAGTNGDEDPYAGLLRERFASHPHAGVLTQVSYAEGRTYMQDLLLRDTDQMSMAHALEVRVPLLDHELVEYVMGLPDAYKESRSRPKRLLVAALGDRLPPEVLSQPKHGFVLPFPIWMRGPLREFCEDHLNPERIEARGILRPGVVQQLWGDFQEGRANVSWSRLWLLVVLEAWLDRNELGSAND
jgi:asparagine synthase (glutamine-hydrolysing)